MEGFRPLELKDRDIFLKYLGEYNFKTYEYSFVTLYLWKKMCNVEYAIKDGVLIIKKAEENKGTYFMQPLGYKREDLKTIIMDLMKIKESCKDIYHLFRDIEIPFLEELKTLEGISVEAEEDENNFDYIYEAEKLISLSGKKLHSKKNHFNQFINTYNYEVKDFADEQVKKDCMIFAYEWNVKKGGKEEELQREYEGTCELIHNMEFLGLYGMAVYVDGKIAGFTIGEKVNKDTAIIHIEKGETEYQGIYSFINKTFLEKYMSDVTYVNREEDLGLESLRKAKTSYHPVRLEKKFIVNLYEVDNEKAFIKR